jgi:hypothetical protein
VGGVEMTNTPLEVEERQLLSTLEVVLLHAR